MELSRARDKDLKFVVARQLERAENVEFEDMEKRQQLQKVTIST